MAEEGVVQLFLPVDGSQPVVGVIGALQLDVLADRLGNEYGLPIGFDPAPCDTVRWISAANASDLDAFIARNRLQIARDLDGDPVFMAQSAYSLQWIEERSPEVKFADLKVSSV